MSRARLKQVAGIVAALVWSAQFTALLVLIAGRTHPDVSFLGLLPSIMLWFLLLYTRRAVMVVFALLAAMIMSLEIAFYNHYHTFLSENALRIAIRSWAEIKSIIVSALPRFVALTLILWAIEGGLVYLARRYVPIRRETFSGWRDRVFYFVITTAIVVSWSLFGWTPDARFAQGLGKIVKQRLFKDSAAAEAVIVPKVDAPPRALPNILLFITDSIRYDEYPGPVEPKPNKAKEAAKRWLGNQIEFKQLRSVATYTAPSMAAISTGRSQAVTRKELQAMPSMFEVASAVSGYSTITPVLWSAHWHPIFEREAQLKSLHSYLTSDTIFGDDQWHDENDQRLLDYVVTNLPTLPKPFFATVHLVGTHTPYSFDKEDEIHQPWERMFYHDNPSILRNAYRNAVLHQDRLLANALERLSKKIPAENLVILFTSDHAEEFGEHKHAYHGEDLLDSQVRVPFWVSYDSSTIRGDKLENLQKSAQQPTTHLDLVPTLIDLWGIYDSVELSPWVRTLEGQSWLRPRQKKPPVSITSCSEAFPCPFATWGLLSDERKLEGQEWAPGWSCWVVSENEEKQAAADDAKCEELKQLAPKWYSTTPNGQPLRNNATP